MTLNKSTIVGILLFVGIFSAFALTMPAGGFVAKAYEAYQKHQAAEISHQRMAIEHAEYDRWLLQMDIPPIAYKPGPAQSLKKPNAAVSWTPADIVKIDDGYISPKQILCKGQNCWIEKFTAISQNRTRHFNVRILRKQSLAFISRERDTIAVTELTDEQYKRIIKSSSVLYMQIVTVDGKLLPHIGKLSDL